MFKTTLTHIRHRSKATPRRPSSRIQIQLLQDIPSLGVKGQLCMVQPAYMRNYLHHNNKACYITAESGPRIPVVSAQAIPRVIKKQVVKPVVKQTIKEEIQGPAAFTMSELSALVGSLRSKTSQARAGPVLNIKEQEPSEGEIGEEYSIGELNDLLPHINQVNIAQLPLNKSKISEMMLKITGYTIPVERIELSPCESPLEFVDTIKQPGKYQVIISSQVDKSTLTKYIHIN